MFDEPRIPEKWVDFEIRTIHSGLVTKRKTLKELLSEDSPQCIMRDGQIHFFDKEELKRIESVASEEEREALKLPMNLHFSLEMEDQCYFSDDVASKVLRRLEGFGEAYPYRDGKMWIPYSLAMELLIKYKTAMQRIFLT